MSRQCGAVTAPTEGPLRVVAAIAVVLGTLTAVLGVWALAAPASFAAEIAPFAPDNAHYLHDVGAFQLGVGTSLLLAAGGHGPSASVPVTGIAPNHFDGIPTRLNPVLETHRPAVARCAMPCGFMSRQNRMPF